jgi:putative SOS response-associated peptidase YedK
MCGRYIYDKFGQIIDVTGEVLTRWPQLSKYEQQPLSFNAAPQQQHPIAMVLDGQLLVTPAHWGLPLPYQRRDPKARRLINARSDNLGRTFSGALKKPNAEQGRCLVLANSFIEWQTTPGGKQPYAIRRGNGAPLVMAGVWMTLPDDPQQLGYAIITCEPSADMAGIHNRQPVILCPEQFEDWVDPATAAEAASAMLTCLPDGELAASPISTRVNSVKNNDSGCIQAA